MGVVYGTERPIDRLRKPIAARTPTRTRNALVGISHVRGAVVKHEFAYPLRELVTLPVTLESPGGLTLAFWAGQRLDADALDGVKSLR
jgi:hypothetical protein